MKSNIIIKDINVTQYKRRNFLTNMRTFNIFSKEFKEKFILTTLDNTIIGFIGRVFYKDDCLLKEYIVLNSNILDNPELLGNITNYCDNIAVTLFKNYIDYELCIRIGETEYTFLTVKQFDSSMSIVMNNIKDDSIIGYIMDVKSIQDYFKSNILK